MGKALAPELRARIVAVGRAEPDLAHAELATRFGLSKGGVMKVLADAGVRREHVSLSAVEGQTHGALKRAMAKYRRGAA